MFPSLFQHFGVLDAPPVPGFSTRRRDRHDLEEPVHRLGTQPPQEQGRRRAQQSWRLHQPERYWIAGKQRNLIPHSVEKQSHFSN
jgi:hypothetical protein